ncbi:TetR/AcrR family transcriptional regulator [Actinomadura harenae]|uniref:TetR family transcriptional regulator n=1 Tax=Actinomadura harenae TaxID=2483351 RepID=A0A3M2M1N7_9ACTN|nr:TetR/AcrR family transcriptional regulator C-terminal domain-containing protein [Actinomadura harenae]RMI40978.1 TetR family transcriptional regulator [Actinomadura harenae]
MATGSQPIPSVWTRPRPRRREQPSLGREQIVAAALELLDAEGIDALSMRKLGTRLNAGATSMYTHVANKDELLELVVDEVYGEIELPAPGDPADWQAAVSRCMHGVRAAFLRHPWAVSVLGETGLAYLGPNVLRLMEGLLAVLEDGGLEPAAAEQAVHTVIAYVVGVATSESATLRTLARSGRTQEEWAAGLLPAAEEATRAYPRLHRIYAARGDQDVRAVRDDDFTVGLECVLQGIAQRFAAAR